jgi:hypothetical protein
MSIVRPVPYNIQSGQYVDAGAITQNLIQIGQDVNANAASAVGNAAQTFAVAAATASNQAVNLGQANSLYAPIAGNAAQTFAVANATVGSQAVNLGQLQNASVGLSLSGLAVKQPITAFPANYDTNAISLMSTATPTAGVSWSASDSRIITTGLGPNGPYIRTASLQLDLTQTAGVLIPNAAQNSNPVALGQLGKFSPLASASLAGTTAGSVTWAQYLQGAFKAFAAQFLSYENNTTNSQTITFPTPFTNTPVVTTNTTGLTVTVSTTTLTINAPNNTTLYTGVIKVEGF